MAGEATAPARRALLIGINEYPKFPRDRKLSGCVNDAIALKSTLRDHFGFPEANITTLFDAEATRQAILAAMDALVAQTGRDDIVVITYSGHGSQMIDRENDEADGWDETIVPYDSGRMPDPNRDITDDEIFLRLRDLGQKTANITLLFDCCHSGTITRDLFGGASRRLPRDERPVEQLPPSPIPDSELEAVREAERAVGPSNYLPVTGRYVLIAGCRSEESSYEYPPRPVASDTTHGALTYFLNRELVQARPGTTYRDIFERLQSQVSGIYPNQHPQIEGTRDREIFGVRDIEPLRFVGVTQVSGNRVVLAAGAAHGLTQGSSWAIYPQGTKQVTDEAPRLGLVRITSVRGQTSDAEIVEAGDPAAVVPGTRAVEVEHDYGDMTLKVDLASAPARLEAQWTELVTELKRSPMVRLAGSDEVADAKIYLLAPRPGAGPGDPVPQLETLTEATWAVVGGGGELLMPAHSIREPHVVALVLDNLEKIAHYIRLRDTVKNPNPSHLLKDKVDFILLRSTADGPWEEAKPDVDGRIVYRLSQDRLGFRIRNRHSGPIYTNVLDFGLTFGISLIYPPEGGNDRHMPNVTLNWGVRPGENLELWLPPEFRGNEGTETLKLIATTQEVDFSWLRQGRVRGLNDHERVSRSPLDDLFLRAGIQTRDARPRISTIEEWTTVERSFLLKRT